MTGHRYAHPHPGPAGEVHHPDGGTLRPEQSKLSNFGLGVDIPETDWGQNAPDGNDLNSSGFHHPQQPWYDL